MFIEEHSVGRNKSRANTLLRMNSGHLFVFATFTLQTRESFKKFMDIMDKPSQRAELWFACEIINLKSPIVPPSYFAVFTYTLSGCGDVRQAFESINFCKLTRSCLLSVEKLYLEMRETSFINRHMFQRLGKADYKILKKTTNPFAALYLSQNVKRAQHFITEELPAMGTKVFSLQKVYTSEEERQYSTILFGIVIKDDIHVTESDKAQLLRFKKEISKFEVASNDDEMLDEGEAFENVTYSELKENENMLKGEFEAMKNLVQLRMSYISEIRDRLKEEERRQSREEFGRL